MASFHTTVSLRGIHFEEFSLGFNLNAAIVLADVGKAVALDVAANTVRLAADGDVIIGRLASVEDRLSEGTKIGAVEMKFANTLPIFGASVIAVGDTVEGAGGGQVKASVAKNYALNMVTEVSTGFVTVLKL